MTHTEGKLKLFDKNRTIAIIDSNKKEVVGWMGFDMSEIPKAQHRANARRLVACWNEHDGLVHDNAQLYQSLQGEMQGRLKAEKERDELVKALRECRSGSWEPGKIDAILARYDEKQQSTV